MIQVIKLCNFGVVSINLTIMVLDPTKKFKPRKVSEIECKAYHEAGHAFYTDKCADCLRV